MELKIRRSQLRNWIDQIFAILGLLLFSRAFVSFFESETGGTGRVLQLIYVVVYGAIAFYLILRWRGVLRVALRDKLLLVLIGYRSMSLSPKTTCHASWRPSTEGAGCRTCTQNCIGEGPGVKPQPRRTRARPPCMEKAWALATAWDLKLATTAPTSAEKADSSSPRAKVSISHPRRRPR